MTHWKIECLVELWFKLHSVLCWPGRAGTKCSITFRGVCLCFCPGIKVGKVPRIEVSGSREECEGSGTWVFPLGTALLCLQHHIPIYLCFIVTVSLSRNTHEKPLIRRRPHRRGSGLRAVQAAQCREHSGLGGRQDTQQRYSIKTKHLHFGFSGSDRSSLLLCQDKKLSPCICGV